MPHDFFIHQFPRREEARRLAVLVAELEHKPRFLHCIVQVESLLDLVRHAFFNINMLACLYGSDDHRCVCVVGCGDDDGVNVRVFEHFAVITVLLGFEAFLGACGNGEFARHRRKYRKPP